MSNCLDLFSPALFSYVGKDRPQARRRSVSSYSLFVILVSRVAKKSLLHVLPPGTFTSGSKRNKNSAMVENGFPSSFVHIAAS